MITAEILLSAIDNESICDSSTCRNDMIYEIARCRVSGHYGCRNLVREEEFLKLFNRVRSWDRVDYGRLFAKMFVYFVRVSICLSENQMEWDWFATAVHQ